MYRDKLINISIFLIIFLIVACKQREFNNPYDPESDINPDPPSSLNSQQVNEKTIRLEWRYNKVVIGFKIKRKTDGTEDFILIATIPNDARVFLDSSLSLGFKYYYQVIAYAASFEAKAETDINHVFNAPDSLIATPISINQLQLTWRDKSVIEKGFKIERRKENESQFEQIGTVNSNVTTFTDNSVTEGILYFYRVKAFADISESSVANTSIFLLQTPSNLSVTPISIQEVNLNWSDNSSVEDGFKIERSTNGSSFQEIGSVGSNTTTFRDGNLISTSIYRYRVRAFLANRFSTYSSEIGIRAEVGWQQISTLPYLVAGMYFINENLGFAVCDPIFPAAIFKTIDGGLTWTLQKGPLSFRTMEETYFTDQNIGWSVGGFCGDASVSFTRVGWVYKTIDGGNTWNEQEIFDSSSPSSCGSVNSIFFINQNTGWIVTDRGGIYRTDDGGINWARKSSPNDSEKNSLTSIMFVNGNLGWAVGWNGTILRSTNGGASWSRQNGNTLSGLYDVYFVDTSNGWIVGENGLILATTNGGTIWNQQISGTQNVLYDAHFADRFEGWVVGFNALLHTKDGGTTWSAESIGMEKSFGAVYVLRKDLVWAAGENIIFQLAPHWALVSQ